uniref:Uncharacterized protein n=1 Tax=Cacopsylla melanoneura TaxID=428564 RepID=A0A8D8XUZ8_9HEMI
MYSRMTQAYDSLVESETVTTCVWGTVYNNMNFSGNKTDTNTDSVPTLQQAVYTGPHFTSYILSHKGDVIIVGYADGTVKTFDCVSGENVVTIRNPNIGSVTCLVTCFKSFYLILGFSSGLIKLYSQTHGELLKIYEKPHKTAVVSIAVNPNNKTFVTLSRDFIMKVWNMTETLPEVKIKEHRDLPLHIKYADPELTAGLDFKGVDNIKSYLVSKEGGHYNFLPPPSLQQTPGQVSFSRDGKKLLSVAHQFIAIHSCPRSQARL